MTAALATRRGWPPPGSRRRGSTPSCSLAHVPRTSPRSRLRDSSTRCQPPDEAAFDGPGRAPRRPRTAAAHRRTRAVPPPRARRRPRRLHPAARDRTARRRGAAGAARAAAPVVVDLCAGSGALALAIAQEVPGSRVVRGRGRHRRSPWLRRNADGTDGHDGRGRRHRPEHCSRTCAARVDASSATRRTCRPARPSSPRSAPIRPVAVFAGADGLAVIAGGDRPRRASCCKAGGRAGRSSTTTRTARPCPALLAPRRPLARRRRPPRSDRPAAIRARPRAANSPATKAG